MKVYIVSVMAFSQLHPDAPAGGTVVESLPALLPAETIEAAAESAKTFATDHWKMSDMWYGHRAVIKAVTKEFYDAALSALEAGVIDESSVIEERIFEFDV